MGIEETKQDNKGNNINWIEIKVEADREAVDSVIEIFSRYGYQHTVVIQEPIVDELSWGNYVIDTTKPVIISAYVAEDHYSQQAIDEITKSLWHLNQIRPVGVPQIREISPEDWMDAWKAHYPIIHAGERLVIKPAWLDYSPQNNEIIIELDPGMAFGTGLHPTTRLCLDAIERYMHEESVCLDLGTGSGILAAAMAKLGAKQVLAVDIDPVAVSAAKSTVERNGISDKVQVLEGSIEKATAQYDFIAANIIASVIIELSPRFQEIMSDEGYLVVSGILEERYYEVALSLTANGLKPVDLIQESDWIAIILQKRSG